MLAVCLILTPTAVWAEASLVGLGGEVSEASHSLDIRVHGLVAEIDTRQTIVAVRDTTAAVYTFDLPSDAAVTDLVVTLPGSRTTKAEIVDASSALEASPLPRGAKPDVALLRLIAIDGMRATYELRVFPVIAGRSISWKMSWIAPLSFRDNRLVLRLPSRGPHDNLVTEKVRVSGSAPTGFDGFDSVVGSGTELGRQLPASFAGSLRQGVVLELVPRSARLLPPRLEHGIVRLPGGKSAVAYSLLAPHKPVQLKKEDLHLVVVVDVSRSMGESGRRAAQQLSQSLLAAAPRNALVSLILYHRHVVLATGKAQRNTEAVRQRLVDAIAKAKLENGSDLAGAVVKVDEQLRAQPDRKARVVIIGDAMTPLDQSPAGLASLVSSQVLRRATFAHITVVPDGGPLPLRAQVAASGLAYNTGGRVLTVRELEVRRRKSKLWSELWAPPPLVDVELHNAGELAKNRPGDLAAGSGTLLVDLYEDRPSAKLRATATSDESEIAISSRSNAALRRAALPLALVDKLGVPEGFAETSLFELAKKAHVVTRASSLWAAYPGDRFARERLAMAKRWGPSQFRRLPPAVERNQDYEPFRFIAARPAPVATPSQTVPRPTGTLTGTGFRRLLRTYVVPKVHGCYRQALLPAKDVRGSFTVVVEITRGEVQHARIEGSLTGNSEWAAKVEACALDAAYSIRVPRVQQGTTAESVHVVRYPLRFKIVDSRGRVIEGRRGDDKVEGEDPLEGIYPE